MWRQSSNRRSPWRWVAMRAPLRMTETGASSRPWWSVVSLQPRPSAVGGIRRGTMMFPSQGSAPRARIPPSSERRSGRSRRALRRCHWLRTPLLRVWRGMMAGRRRHRWLHTPYSECGRARQPVGGACSYPRIFGVGACARPTMGRCPVSCSGGCVTSRRSRPFVGRSGTGGVGSSLGRYEGAWDVTCERSLSNGLVTNGSELQGSAAFV